MMTNLLKHDKGIFISLHFRFIMLLWPMRWMNMIAFWYFLFCSFSLLCRAQSAIKMKMISNEMKFLFAIINKQKMKRERVSCQLQLVFCLPSSSLVHLHEMILFSVCDRIVWNMQNGKWIKGSNERSNELQNKVNPFTFDCIVASISID